MGRRINAIMLSVLIVVGLLSGCAPTNQGDSSETRESSQESVESPSESPKPSNEPSSGPLGDEVHIPPEDYPLTQGSNPTRIISEKLFERFTGMSELDTDADKIQHTGTSEAYIQYMEQDSAYEMIIAQQPNPAVEERLKETIFKPIAKDALVFITNASNPVEDLSLEEAKDIVTGRVTNWKDVGGADEPIQLFRRNDTGGSQILLEGHVLKGATMAEVPPLHIANDMMEMSKCVAEETKDGSTFGYTTYYYAEYSEKRDDLKTISIDGVKASYSSILHGDYPLPAWIYMGVRDKEGPAGQIYDWMFTPEGQALIQSTGYVALGSDAE